MNLRIKDQSLRFRLEGSDLEELRKSGRVGLNCRLSGEKSALGFTSSVLYEPDRRQSDIKMSPYEITVLLCESDLARIEADSTGDGILLRFPASENSLSVAIEKDIGCRHLR